MINELETLETSSRNKVMQFEISTLKNNEKFNKTLSALNDNKELIEGYSSKIRGFNYWAAFIAFSLTHYMLLVNKKKLLYEMNPKHVFLQLGPAAAAGILSGLIFGNTISYSFSLYRKYYRTNRNMNLLIHDFINTYNPQTILKPLH